jgi:hypothetical protein
MPAMDQVRTDEHDQFCGSTRSCRTGDSGTLVRAALMSRAVTALGAADYGVGDAAAALARPARLADMVTPGDRSACQ